MSRSKQTSKGRGRRRVVTALGVAGALSLAGGASASISSAGDIPTQNTAPVLLAEEEISDVSLATFYVFDKENAGAHRSGVQLAARGWDTEAAEAVQRGCGGCARAAEAAARVPRLRSRRLRRLWRLWRRLLFLGRTRPGLLKTRPAAWRSTSPSCRSC